jgi:hypothetical protein
VLALPIFSLNCLSALMTPIASKSELLFSL